MLQYKVIIRLMDRDETAKQFDFLDEVLDYLQTQLGHVFGRKDRISMPARTTKNDGGLVG